MLIFLYTAVIPLTAYVNIFIFFFNVDIRKELGEGNGNLLQCFCPENSRDGGAWSAAVYGVAHSQTHYWSDIAAAAVTGLVARTRTIWSKSLEEHLSRLQKLSLLHFAMYFILSTLYTINIRNTYMPQPLFSLPSLSSSTINLFKELGERCRPLLLRNS